jgi:hypothetical protein
VGQSEERRPPARNTSLNKACIFDYVIFVTLTVLLALRQTP